MTKGEPRRSAAIVPAHAPRTPAATSGTLVRAAGWVGRSKRSAAIWARTRGRALACLLLVLTIFSTLALPATARDLTPADRTAIGTVISGLTKAIEAGDFSGMVHVIPPRILDRIATRAKTDRAGLIALMTDVFADSFASITFEHYAFDLDAARPGEGSDGSPYLLIPLSMTIRTGDGQRLAMQSWSLAVQEGAHWYLVDVDEAPQLTMFLDLFPQFKGLEIPTGSIKVLQ